MHTSFHIALPAIAMAAALFATSAGAAAATPVTRHLQQTVNAPAGDTVAIENLVGHMQIVQGTGPVQIDATVVAAGDHAQALAQGVKLDTSTTGTQVRVHVYYPVDQHTTFLYNPRNARTSGDDEVCILGHFICIHGRSSSNLTYQGRRVTVHESASGGSGAPLYVDVVVHVPAQASLSATNDVGLLQADNVADNLDLSTQSGDVRLAGVRGRIDATTDGGDLAAGGIDGKARLMTNGGDIHLKDFQGHLDARSNGGDLTASNLTGDLRVGTNGGDMRLDTVAGNLSASSSGGDVRIGGNLAALKSLRARTAGGNMTLTGNFAALTTLHAETSGGDLLLRAGNLSAHLTASTSGGSIHVHLPNLRNVSSSSDSFSADVGAATGTASLSSAGGDVTVQALPTQG
ncbi:MAG TPA: DUF4097 family beta strand repeat-containing protein [Rhodanobacteraceae bacterium]